MSKALFLVPVIGFGLSSFAFVLHAGFSAIYDKYGAGATILPAVGCFTTLLLIACLLDSRQFQEKGPFSEQEPSPNAHSAENGQQ